MVLDSCKGAAIIVWVRPPVPSSGESPLLDLRASEGGVVVRLHVKPRSSRDMIDGVRQGALVVRVTAPTVDGAANDAVARLLARRLGRPASAVAVLHGKKGREKTVFIAGVDTASAQDLLLRKP